MRTLWSQLPSGGSLLSPRIIFLSVKAPLQLFPRPPSLGAPGLAEHRHGAASARAGPGASRSSRCAMALTPAEVFEQFSVPALRSTAGGGAGSWGSAPYHQPAVGCRAKRCRPNDARGVPRRRPRCRKWP